MIGQSLVNAVWRLLNRKQTPPTHPHQYIRSPFRRVAGEEVNPDSSLTIPTVWACVKLISETISYLPWYVNKTEVARGSPPHYLPDPADPVSSLLDRRSSDETSAQTLRESLISSALLWGHGVAEIERDFAGNPIALHFIAPDRVTIVRNHETGRLIFRVTGGFTGFGQSQAGNQDLDPEDVFYVHGLGFDGVTGYSVVAYAARTIGLTMNAEIFGTDFFGNQATPSGVLQTGDEINKEGQDRLRAQWEEIYGGARNSGKVAVLEQGMEYKPLTMPLEDAQYLETRNFQVPEICRWFGVPPILVGSMDKATFNNTENLNRLFMQAGLMPWIRRLEHEADYKLIRGRSNQSTRMDVRGFLRGDSAAQSTMYKDMFGIGALNLNEIRADFGRGPIENGDKHFIPGNNMVPLDKADEIARQQAQPAPEPESEPASEPEDNPQARKSLTREIMGLVGARE